MFIKKKLRKALYDQKALEQLITKEVEKLSLCDCRKQYQGLSKKIASNIDGRYFTVSRRKDSIL